MKKAIVVFVCLVFIAANIWAPCFEPQMFICCALAYAFIIAIFGSSVYIVRKKSPDRKLSTYYYKLPREKQDNPYVLSLVSSILIYIVLGFFVFLMSLLVICLSEQGSVVRNFVCKVSWDQWFNTLIVNICIPVLITVITSLGIFLTFEKRQFVFYNVHDVLTAWKIPDRIFHSICWLSISLVAVATYYIMYFSEPSDYRLVLLPTCALTATIGIFVVLGYCIYTLSRVVEFIFCGSIHYKLLDRLYMRVYHPIRRNSENITKANADRIEFYLQHMLNNIPNHKIQDEKIKFVCFLDDLACLPPKTTFVTSCKFSLMISFFTITLGCAFYSILSSMYSSTFENNTIWCLSLCFVDSLFLTYLLCFTNYVRTVAVICFLGPWGFKTESQHPKFFSSRYTSLLSKGIMSKCFCQQLQGYYNIICAFRDVISVSQEVADFVLVVLYKNMEMGSCNSLLYASCLCLYKERFGTIHNHSESFYHLIQKLDTDREKLKGNVEAIIQDVLRKETNILVNELFDDINYPTVPESEEMEGSTREKKNNKKTAKNCKIPRRIFNLTFQFFKIN